MKNEIAKIERVPFAGTEVCVVESNGEKFVPAKMFIEGIGIEWEPIRKLITRDEVLNKTTAIMAVVSNTGPKNTLCIQMKCVALLLAKINPARYKQNKFIHDRLVKYQMECMDALYNYFTNGVAVRFDGVVEKLNALQCAYLELAGDNARLQQISDLFGADMRNYGRKNKNGDKRTQIRRGSIVANKGRIVPINPPTYNIFILGKA